MIFYFQKTIINRSETVPRVFFLLILPILPCVYKEHIMMFYDYIIFYYFNTTIYLIVLHL